MEKKNAIWCIIGILGGIAYPFIHAIVLFYMFPFLYPLDFLGIQIIILRIAILFIFLTVLYLLIRAYQILKKGGKLKETSAQMTRVSGKPKTGAMLAIGMGLIGGAVAIYFYIFSIAREDIFYFATWAFGIGYWLVIGGIMFLFAWVVLRPIKNAISPPSAAHFQAKKETRASKEASKEEAEEQAKEEKRKKKGIKTVVEMEAEMRAEEEKRLQELEKNRPKGELKTKI